MPPAPSATGAPAPIAEASPTSTDGPVDQGPGTALAAAQVGDGSMSDVVAWLAGAGAVALTAVAALWMIRRRSRS